MQYFQFNFCRRLSVFVFFSRKTFRQERIDPFSFIINKYLIKHEKKQSKYSNIIEYYSLFRHHFPNIYLNFARFSAFEMRTNLSQHLFVISIFSLWIFDVLMHKRTTLVPFKLRMKHRSLRIEKKKRFRCLCPAIEFKADDAKRKLRLQNSWALRWRLPFSRWSRGVCEVSCGNLLLFTEYSKENDQFCASLR